MGNCQQYTMPNKLSKELWEIKDLILMLQTASADDEITIYIDGYGGDGIICQNLYRMIDECLAKVKIVVWKVAHSAYAILALAGDELHITDGAQILFHLTAPEDCTTIEDRKFSNTHHDKYTLDKWFIKVLNGILSTEQEQRLLDGYDVILTGRELKAKVGG